MMPLKLSLHPNMFPLCQQAGVRQLEARAEDLKAAAGGHEGRARDAAAEVAKGNRIIEKLTVRNP